MGLFSAGWGFNFTLSKTGVHGDVVFASKPSQNTNMYNVLWWKGVQDLGFTAKTTHGQSRFSDIRVDKGYISEIIPISHMHTWHQWLAYMVLPLIATTCLLATGYRFKTANYTCSIIDLPKVYLSLHGFHWLHALHHLHAFHLLHGLHDFMSFRDFMLFIAFCFPLPLLHSGLRWSVALWDLVLVQVLGVATGNQIAVPLAEKEYYNSIANGPHIVHNSDSL